MYMYSQLVMYSHIYSIQWNVSLGNRHHWDQQTYKVSKWDKKVSLVVVCPLFRCVTLYGIPLYTCIRGLTSNRHNNSG